MTDTERYCTNPTCSMHRIKVRTLVTNCLGCKTELRLVSDDFISLFGDLFRDDPLSQHFKG